jgi:hypothetical protein
LQSPPPFEIPPQPLAHPRRGCLSGCLVGCVKALFAILIIGGGLVLLLDAALAPYTYYYGGHFHLPGWQGQGWIHSEAAGGDYWLWLRIDPTTPAYRKSDINGLAYLCTPKGERFRLNVGGMLPRNRPTNTIGVPIHLYMHNRPIFWQFNNDQRPSLDFYGAFGDRQLVLENRGSLPTAFRSDGTLYPLNDPNRPWSKERVTFTLYESSPWTVGPPCPVKPKP